MSGDALDTMLDGYGVPGVSLAWFEGGKICTQVSGWTDKSERAGVHPNAPFGLGALGRPFVAALAIDCLSRARVSLDAPVVDLLRKARSHVRVVAAAECPAPWAREVTTRRLLAEQSGVAAGTHKSRFEVELRPGLFACGSAEREYELLLRVVEAVSGLSAAEAARKFCTRCGLIDVNLTASGHVSAAPRDWAPFLVCLARAHAGDRKAGGRSLTPRTARLLLGRTDVRAEGKGAAAVAAATREGTLSGQVVEAGPNRVFVAFGQTPRTRTLSVCCFEGPDAKSGPSGFVLCANLGTDAATRLVCDAAQVITKKLNWEGVDFGAAFEYNQKVTHSMRGVAESGDAKSRGNADGHGSYFSECVRRKILAAFSPRETENSAVSLTL